MTDTAARIKRCIVQALELPVWPEDTGDDGDLIGVPMGNGAMVDSLAALEIVVALSTEFGLPLDDVPREAFQSVRALTEYIEQQVAAVG
jgi:acyl carrier protein